MVDRILVPFDESEQARTALEHALTTHPDAEVVVLNVIDLMEAGYSAPFDGGLPGYWEEWYEQEEQAAEELLARAQEIADEYDAELETEVVVGRPARSINEYADENDIDQILIGSHGRTGVSRILLGSVAEAVVRRAHCPVTVVR
ncbi:universal stress protein [Haloarchaeobius salinus]|uniref:universal stress protein n=1 Tax=Haloarchaeobius salinus TaxID=1198298 RepID=UPI00210DC888|nr:universal stress protein [Haloarchaeobius salinus]